jgi:hypothetical protein
MMRVGVLPEDRGFTLNGTTVRVMRLCKENKLIVWDDANHKKILTFELNDLSYLSDHLVLALAHFRGEHDNKFISTNNFVSGTSSQIS